MTYPAMKICRTYLSFIAGLQTAQCSWSHHKVTAVIYVAYMSSFHQFSVTRGHEMSMASDVLRAMSGARGMLPLGIIPRRSSPAVTESAGSFAA